MPGSAQNRTTWIKNIARKAILLVMESETQAQNTLPNAFPMLTIPTIPAAATALTEASSWNIGASWEITEIPAEVFRNKSNHSAHHRQVESASRSVKSRAARCP